MNTVTVHKHGEFKYEPSILELFVEAAARTWNLTLSNLLPRGPANASLHRRSILPEENPSHDEYWKLVHDGHKFDEAEIFLCNAGKLSYERALHESSFRDELRWNNFTEKDLLDELYGGQYIHEERAEIRKDGKSIKVEFDPGYGYKLEVYNFDIHNAIPQHEVRCSIHTSVKHNLWTPVHFNYSKFAELAGEKTAQQIAEEDTFSTLRNYLGLVQDVK